MRARLIAFVIAGFLIGAIAGAAVLLVANPQGGQPVQSSGAALIGGPFSLVGADGKTVTDADFHGRYMLVFFGFTHCPDICPAELQVIAQALDKLGDKGKKVVPVFITLDPERDTPRAMADYLSASDYSVDHSALVYFMDPEGRYVTHFSYGTSADELAEKLNKIL